MGNTLIEDKGKGNLMKAFDTYTEQEIGVRQNVLFENKLFKTLHYKMHQQNLLVKVHLMRKQITLGELYTHNQNFIHLKERLSPYSNLMAFYNLINFNNTKPSLNEQGLECNKDYLAVTRQLIYTTLEDRLQSNYTLPKCLLNYLALQMLNAVYVLHSHNLYHGHIRSSNFLLTSSDFLIISDFACYKPSYLNELEIIRNVYKSSISKCTLAPEKYNELQEVQQISQMTKQQISVLQMMDMFSVGCVLAEIFSGEILFSLEQLLQFKKGEFEPVIKIEGAVGDLIKNLINPVPEQRYTAQQALQTFFQECCNQTYELLYYVGVAFNVNGSFMQPDIRVALLRKIISVIEKKQFIQVLPIPLQQANYSKFSQICKETEFPRKTIYMQLPNGANADDVIATTLENSGNLIQREFKEAQSEIQQLPLQLSMVQKLKQSIQRVPESNPLRQTWKSSTYAYVKQTSNQEYVILILWLLNQMRNCRFMQTRLCGLELLEFLCSFIDENTKYNLIIPNLGYFCEDSEAQVQYNAFNMMLTILKGIQNPPFGSKEILIFKLYIWEHIKNRLQDISNNPQLALRIGDIAEVLDRYKRVEEKSAFLLILQKKFQENKIGELALITNKISDVLKYYECNQTLEILTYLISQINTPQLKVPLLEVFFDIYKYYVGTDTTKILLACLQFSTRHEMSLFHMVRFLRQATEQNLLPIDKIKQYIKEVAPLMLHHNKWIRDEVQNFILLVLQQHSSLEIYLHFHPHIKKYLKIDVPHINAEVFTSLIQKPICSRWYEIKNQTIEPRLPSTLSERECFNYTNYLEDYFKRSKPGVEQVIQQSNQRVQCPNNKLNQRVNEFIEAAFRVGLMQLDANKWEDFIRKGKTWEDFLVYMKNNGVDLKNDTLSKKKVKYLQELQLQLQYIIPQGSTQWVNLLNFTLITNQISLKSQQLQIQDIQFQRNIQQPILRPFKVSNSLVTTITEHKGIVTAVKKYSDNRRFISGSCDGTVKIYDIKRIEEDFTNGSVSTIRIMEGDVNSRVTALCPIEGTESFVVGTNTGAVSLYTNERHSSTFIKGDSEIRKIVDQGNSFMYVTEKGTLTIEDIRCRNGLRFNIGRQRGLVTSMVQMPNQYTTLIGTINGYLILYDVRSTLIVNLFQLLNHQEQPLPIFSIANMNKVSQLEGMSSDATNLVGLGYQSNNNEVGFWDINKQNENLNPALFLYCSDKKHPIIETPRLQSVLKTEQFTNYNNNLQQQCYYDFFNQHHQVDLISYLKDPLTSAERQVKERWLRNTKNLYLNLKSAFESKSIVTSLICLNSKVDNNRQENTFITASTDRSIQSWTLQSDALRQDKNNDREYPTNVISSPFNSIRRFKQCPSGDVYTIQDFEFKNQAGVQSVLEHKDCITDMEYLDNDNSYLISASRDHTIKIWK